jgi:hypothetical protein
MSCAQIAFRFTDRYGSTEGVRLLRHSVSIRGTNYPKYRHGIPLLQIVGPRPFWRLATIDACLITRLSPGVNFSRIGSGRWRECAEILRHVIISRSIARLGAARDPYMGHVPNPRRECVMQGTSISPGDCVEVALSRYTRRFARPEMVTGQTGVNFK